MFTLKEELFSLCSMLCRCYFYQIGIYQQKPVPLTIDWLEYYSHPISHYLDLPPLMIFLRKNIQPFQFNWFCPTLYGKSSCHFQPKEGFRNSFDFHLRTRYFFPFLIFISAEHSIIIPATSVVSTQMHLWETEIFCRKIRISVPLRSLKWRSSNHARCVILEEFLHFEISRTMV